MAKRDKAFELLRYINPATGTESWRVQGWLNGKRIRENFSSKLKGESRRLELETIRLGQLTPEKLRATWLTPEQLITAESIFTLIPEPTELKLAVDWWRRTGKQSSANVTDIRLDDAVTRFKSWLEKDSGLRVRTRQNLASRVGVFASEVGNVPLSGITNSTIQDWNRKRSVSLISKKNDRRALGRFFSWCIEEPQKFINSNPARGVKLPKSELPIPAVFGLRQCMRLLVAARRFDGGRFLRYVTLGLFCGLRPDEAERLRDDQINLSDHELRLEGTQTKTHRGRVVELMPCAAAWLNVCRRIGSDGTPAKNRKKWRRMLRRAGISAWPQDVLRHTQISNHVRISGSYADTARSSGNSEAMIRAHYEGRVTSDEAKAFWCLHPSRTERRRAREHLAPSNLVQLSTKGRAA